MDSDPSPQRMRFCVFPVSDTGWRKLKPLPIRICQRNRYELKAAAVLADGLEGPDFLFDGSDGIIIASKTTDKQNCR